MFTLLAFSSFTLLLSGIILIFNGTDKEATAGAIMLFVAVTVAIILVSIYPGSNEEWKEGNLVEFNVIEDIQYIESDMQHRATIKEHEWKVIIIEDELGISFNPQTHEFIQTKWIDKVWGIEVGPHWIYEVRRKETE